MKKIIFTIVSIVVVFTSVFAVLYITQQKENKKDQEFMAAAKPAETECLLWVMKHDDGVHYQMSTSILSPEYDDIIHSSEIIIPAGKGKICISIDKIFDFEDDVMVKRILRQDTYNKDGHNVTLILTHLCQSEGRWDSVCTSMVTISSQSDFEESEQSPYLVVL